MKLELCAGLLALSSLSTAWAQSGVAPAAIKESGDLTTASGLVYRVVVEGTAKVTVNDEVRLISENQSVYIPLGAVHRMENPGKLPMVLIEVQTGSYLGEDDIIRYEDIYART